MPSASRGARCAKGTVVTRAFRSRRAERAGPVRFAGRARSGPTLHRRPALRVDFETEGGVVLRSEAAIDARVPASVRATVAPAMLAYRHLSRPPLPAPLEPETA